MIDAFILGYGFVGKATAKALDIPWYFSREQSNLTLEEGSKKKYCVICLPTPTDGRGDQGKGVEVIADYIKQISQYGEHPLYVVRSTVLPGTCRHLAEITRERVVSNPEFLSEATAYEDAAHPTIKVLGADSTQDMEVLERLWITVPSKLVVRTDTVTAEMIKYTFNTFAATKIVFVNAIYDACQKTGADYEKVREALHKHPWGSKHHLIPVDKGGRGAGGHCIPKDLLAFATWSNSDFLKMVEKVNHELLERTHKE